MLPRLRHSLPPVRNFISTADLVPVPAATLFNAINRPRLLDAYIAINVEEGWQLSFGQQSLSWGPGPGGSLLVERTTFSLSPWLDCAQTEVHFPSF